MVFDEYNYRVMMMKKAFSSAQKLSVTTMKNLKGGEGKGLAM